MIAWVCIIIVSIALGGMSVWMATHDDFWMPR